VREVIDVVKRVSGVELQVLEEARRPGDPAMLVAVAERAQSLLGCNYRFNNLETIVRDAWRWEKKFAGK